MSKRRVKKLLRTCLESLKPLIPPLQRTNEARLLSEATERLMKSLMQLLEIQARDIGQIDILRVPPQPLHRVEVRGIGGLGLDVDLPSRLCCKCAGLAPPIRPRRPTADPRPGGPGDGERDGMPRSIYGVYRI